MKRATNTSAGLPPRVGCTAALPSPQRGSDLSIQPPAPPCSWNVHAQILTKTGRHVAHCLIRTSSRRGSKLAAEYCRKRTMLREKDSTLHTVHRCAKKTITRFRLIVVHGSGATTCRGGASTLPRPTRPSHKHDTTNHVNLALHNSLFAPPSKSVERPCTCAAVLCSERRTLGSLGRPRRRRADSRHASSGAPAQTAPGGASSSRCRSLSRR